MFNCKKEPNEKISRIPISKSPLPFRRTQSLRLRGEKPTTFPHSKSCTLANGVGNFDLRSPEKAYTSNISVIEEGNSLNTDYQSRSGRRGVSTPRNHREKTMSLSLANNKIGNNHISPTISLPSTTPPTSPFNNTSRGNFHSEWDLDSLESTTSNLSIASCDHASIARNGTTFSGKSMRYIFHCNQSDMSGEYLTPTQRAHRQIKKLKSLLRQAQLDLEQKDSDILKLTKEVVELKLYKAAICSPEERSNSSDAITVKENTSEDQITPETEVLSPSQNCMNSNSSYVDSGHYEDMNSSRDSADLAAALPNKLDKEIESRQFEDGTKEKLILEYEQRFHELIKAHEEETHQLKQKHNDKVEQLLLRINEINEKYWQLVPEHEAAKEKIRDLEKQLEDTCKKLEQQEEEHKTTNLEMYKQGQEAAKLEQENRVMELARQTPPRVSVPELLQELQVTKNELENIKAMYRQLMEARSRNKIDPEITLQFLKSAIYYFLTDKENSSGHLKAIQSILGFTDSEISNIDKARLL